MNLVEALWLSATFLESERYGLTSQIRRTAVSTPSNIAEGTGRKGDKELVQFLHIALDFLSELETHYLIAVRLNHTEKNKNVEILINDVK